MSEDAPHRFSDDDRLAADWADLQQWLRERFGRQVSTEGALFLIGLHARGLGYEPFLPKYEKEDLIREGSYHALETLGYFARDEEAANGRKWRRLRPVPGLSEEDQERLLQRGIVTYVSRFIRGSADARDPS